MEEIITNLFSGALASAEQVRPEPQAQSAKDAALGQIFRCPNMSEQTIGAFRFSRRLPGTDGALLIDEDMHGADKRRAEVPLQGKCS